jgi:endonuclease/exonuclease/phosphatase family metal-dependent hydrolase
MTVIVTWNIQYGKGVDGVLDLGRIVDTVRAKGDFDVLCVQEIAVNYAEMGGGAKVDQTAQLAELLPGYAPFFGAAVDRPGAKGARRKFGNMILSRLKVLDVATHMLPRPEDDSFMHMPRNAVVALIETRGGPLRVMTTHLEFHGTVQRAAQAGRLRALYAEAAANDRRAPQPGPGAYAVPAPAIGTVLCGDFNLEKTEPPYSALTTGFTNGLETLVDAWTARYPVRPHEPTCGIFDAAQWPQGPHARDFVFVSEGLVKCVRSVSVDTETAASDHQPVRIDLED